MDLGKNGGYIALLVAFGMILISSMQNVRDAIGIALNGVFGPLIDTYQIPFYILIIILSSITALYSSIIQKYTIDYEKMKKNQDVMKEFQKEYREAMLSQDEKRIKKLDAKKDKMMKDQLEMSQQQFKPMAYILVLTIPLFFFLIYRLSTINETIIMPFFGSQNLTNPVLAIVPVWMLWYFICSIAISQVIRKSLDIGGL
jgi:uncharacterized membrane protein (DUF106 family)